MEISPKTLSTYAGASVLPTPGVAREGGPSPVTGGAPGTEDSVSLSDKAREIQRAVAALEKIPDVRQDKVEGIRAQMASGTYDIKGEGIADKMIHESLINTLI